VSTAGLHAPYLFISGLFHLLLALNYDSLGQQDKGELPDGAPLSAKKNLLAHVLIMPYRPS